MNTNDNKCQVREAYSKEIQTEESSFQQEETKEDEEQIFTSTADVSEQIEAQEEQELIQDEKTIDIEEVLHSQSFTDFVQKTSLYVERILQHPYDPFFNFFEAEVTESYVTKLH